MKKIRKNNIFLNVVPFFVSIDAWENTGNSGSKGAFHLSSPCSWVSKVELLVEIQLLVKPSTFVSKVNSETRFMSQRLKTQLLISKVGFSTFVSKVNSECGS